MLNMLNVGVKTEINDGPFHMHYSWSICLTTPHQLLQYIKFKSAAAKSMKKDKVLSYEQMFMDSVCNSLEEKTAVHKPARNTILCDNYSTWIQTLHFSSSATTLKPLLINPTHLWMYCSLANPFLTVQSTTIPLGIGEIKSFTPTF